MRGFYDLATWRGVPIRLHYTWFSAALLGIAVLLTHTLPRLLPTLGFGERLLCALLIAGGFVGSVLLHEVAQMLLAMACGRPVRAVNLYPLGALTRLPDRNGDPWAAFWIATVGPATSCALWLFLAMLASDTRMSPVVNVPIALVGQLSLYVGIINLLPGLPLDGGRMVRAIFRMLGGSYERGTVLANRLGVIIAYWLMLSGIALVALRQEWLWGGVLLLTGWSLLEAGGTMYRRVAVAELMNRLTAAHVVRSSIRTIAPETTLRVGWAIVKRHRLDAAVPVVQDGRFCGMITSDQIRNIPQGEWDIRTVADMMAPADQFAPVTSSTPLCVLLPRLVTTARGQAAPVVVVDDGLFIGLIHPDEVSEILDLEEAFGVGMHAFADDSALTPANPPTISNSSKASHVL